VLFEEEETNVEQLGNTCLKKEKGKMVYVIDDEEVENLYVEHTKGMCEVLDIANEKARAYPEPMKTNK
ncbi:hypothetical protein KI387_016541, partial [Taxus chinensis]